MIRCVCETTCLACAMLKHRGAPVDAGGRRGASTLRRRTVMPRAFRDMARATVRGSIGDGLGFLTLLRAP